MAIEYFCCYHSYERRMEHLSDEEVGRLFRALLRFSITGERMPLPGREEVAFDFIVYDIEKSQQAYREKCEQNRKNAEKRYQKVAGVEDCADNEDGRTKFAPTAGGRSRMPAPTDWFVQTLEGCSHRSVAGVEDCADPVVGANCVRPGEFVQTLKGVQTRGDPKDRFEVFWEAYPRKMGKRDARRAFARLNPDPERFRQMMDALARQKQSRQWQADGGLFIPAAARWITGERWNDDPGEPGDQREPGRTEKPTRRLLTDPPVSSLDIKAWEQDAFRQIPTLANRAPPAGRD